MSIFDWFKRRGRSEMKEAIISRVDPTRGYHATNFYRSETILNKLPPFHLFTGRLMLQSDQVVRFAHNVRNAALMVAEVEIKARNPLVKKWLQKQWDVIWGKNAQKVVAAKRWGFQALQVEYIQGPDKLVHVEGLKDFAPFDVRALECEGKHAGFRVKCNAGEKKLLAPRALWLTFDAEYGSPYGTGLLRRQYPAWYEKWMDGGARELLQLRMMKDAYIGDIFWYPQNMSITTPDGTQVSWRDILREVGENRKSGSAITLPNLLDSNGNKLVDYTPPIDVAGGSQIFEWRDSLDEGIFMAADVPLEVVKAQENGGFSGRSIPFMVVLSVCTQELKEYVQCIDRDILRPLAWLNFGGEPEYEIKPKSLVESFAADSSGSPMGGGAIGGQPGQQQRPMQQGPPQAEPQRAPQAQQFDEQDSPQDQIAAAGARLAQRRIKTAAERIAELLSGNVPPALAPSIVAEELRKLGDRLGTDLGAALTAAHFAGAADAITSIPASMAPAVAATGQPPAPPAEPPSIADLFPEEPGEPRVRFPVVDDALETLRDSRIFSGNDYRQVAAEVRQGAFGITSDLTEGAVERIRDVLAENIAEGPDREAFTELVTREVEGALSDAHIEQIFRTNVSSAFSNGSAKALENPLVVDAFPYRAYFATTDQRTRKEHIALERLGLNGTNIYRADDPTWRKFRPPWSWQCRCSWVPQTVEQAARQGVVEAKEWLARAKAMADELGGPWPQYLSRTAPAQRAWVTPPPFEPPPEFSRPQ